MKLYEYEGKRLLAEAGLKVPRGVVVDSESGPVEDLTDLTSAVVKAQVLRGARGKAGGVLGCPTREKIQEAVDSLLQKELFGMPVKEVLVEERLEIARESYLSISYQKNKPTVIACLEGGMGVEEIRHTRPDVLVVQPVSITRGLDEAAAKDVLRRAGFNGDAGQVAPILVNLYRFFLDHDATLVEINPVIKTRSGEWFLADAKIEIDDDAAYRLGKYHLPERPGSGRPPTELEQLAHQNDLIDNRGAAGRMFYEIEDGNIVILAAGGGTSAEALDALFLLGGRPAIFTEHSGNPTPQKVKGITKIALRYPGPIDAVWVIGGRANFTDIYETVVDGILGGIRELENFDKTTPIVIRRAGPRDDESFEALRRLRATEGYNIYLRGMATSIYESARMVTHLANKHYMERKKGRA
jgi:succinyl-CoA synthetase beta subunit